MNMLTISDLHNEQELSSLEMSAVRGGTNTLSLGAITSLVTADATVHVQHDFHFVKNVDKASPILHAGCGAP
jgi:type VI protein secretion system component Hcp